MFSPPYNLKFLTPMHSYLRGHPPYFLARPFSGVCFPLPVCPCFLFFVVPGVAPGIVSRGLWFVAFGVAFVQFFRVCFVGRGVSFLYCFVVGILAPGRALFLVLSWLLILVNCFMNGGINL